MSPIELMSDNITRNSEILKMTLADFSQEDMLTRPVPGANHAAWQLGHLIGGAGRMIGIAPDLIPQAAGQIGQNCTGKTAHIDDPAFSPDKTQLLEVFAQTQGAIARNG